MALLHQCAPSRLLQALLISTLISTLNLINHLGSKRANTTSLLKLQKRRNMKCLTWTMISILCRRCGMKRK
jgi:hypothetical protein